MQVAPSFVESLVNKESILAKQPNGINIILKPHQLAMIHRMTEFECHKTIKIQNSNVTEFEQDFFYKTKIGFLCDKVGSGKSFTILGVISSNKYLKPSLNFDSVLGLYCLQSFNPHILNMNIIAVPHGIFTQWQKYIEEFTTLKTRFIRKKRNSKISIIM